MTSRVGRYIDVEKLVITYLKPLMAGVLVSNQVPGTIPAGGVLWVSLVGGPTDWDHARPRVDLRSLVPGEQNAADGVTEAAHGHMDALAGQTVAGQAVDVVSCVTYPHRVFWSATVDSLVATYALDMPSFVDV